MAGHREEEEAAEMGKKTRLGRLLQEELVLIPEQ